MIVSSDSVYHDHRYLYMSSDLGAAPEDPVAPKSVGRFGLITTAKTLLAAALMSLAAWLALGYLPVTNKYLLLLSCLLIAFGVFFLAARLLRIPEAAQLFSRTRRPSS